MKKLLTTILTLILTIVAAFALFACNSPTNSGTSDAGDDMPAQGEEETLPQPYFSDADIEILNAVYSNQSAYLKGNQISVGAYLKWSASDANNEVVPYFACFVALALLDDDRNASSVKKYLDWHFSALNADDYNNVAYTIYDYTATFNTDDYILTSKDSYDSTDSYAALFLMALEKYYDVTGDIDYLNAHSAEIRGIYNAILSTYDNGLTNAKPDYEIKYLMDNSEVYAGLGAAVKLFSALKDTAYMTSAESYQVQIKNSIRGMYRKYNGLYAPNFGAVLASADTFYPDMAAQLYPVIFGVFDATEEYSVSVYEKFKEKFGTVESFDDATDFPWMIMAYGAACYGDYDFAFELIKDAKGRFVETNAYPWYSMEGAMTMLTVTKLLSAHK